jgi:hypothetical protein
MKNIFLKLSLIFSVFALIVSCDDDNDYAGESTTQATSGNATITLAFDATQSFVEKNEVYTYTVTLSEPQIADVKIPITLVGGTATEHSDFDFDHEVKISRNTMSAEGTISVYADTDPEDTENFTLQIGNSEGIANASVSPQTVNFTIENFVSDVLDISFDFCATVINEGDEYDWASFGGDIDVLISSVADFDINDPWASDLGYYGAATGDCPELLTLDKADLGDGDYVLWHDLYANGNSVFWESQLVPIVATFTQAGLFQVTVVQDDSQAQNAQDPGAADDDYAGTRVNGVVALLTIAGDVYTVKDFEGNEIKSGKVVDFKMRTPRPAELNKVNTGLRLNK